MGLQSPTHITTVIDNVNECVQHPAEILAFNISYRSQKYRPLLPEKSDVWSTLSLFKENNLDDMLFLYVD